MRNLWRWGDPTGGNDLCLSQMTGFPLSYYSVWPYFLCTALILMLANGPLLRWADTPPNAVQARRPAIDGLRGFLAMGVFFHHAAIYHQYLITGEWALPPNRFYADLGRVGVAMFFMITGYLFWAQILRAKGKVAFAEFYLKRLFRIFPLYLVLASVVLLTVGFLTGWQLEEPPVKLAAHVMRWLSGGILAVGDVNGYAGTGLISAWVTWSLRYEWIFYGSLFATSFFARNHFLGVLLPLLVLLVTAPLLLRDANDLSLACTLMFSVGMTAASVANRFNGKQLLLPQWALSAGVIGCLGLVLLFVDRVYGVLPISLIGIAFALVVFDASVFGLLLTRSAKRLGDISYGIYLLQGPTLFLIFLPQDVRAFATISPWAHWAIISMAALVLVLLATLAHQLIERPGIRAGKWVWARMAPNHS